MTIDNDDKSVENEAVEDNNDDLVTLDDRVSGLEQSQGLMQILADPDIQQVLEAKRLGKVVSVVADEEASLEDEIDLGLPEDDPTTEVATTILSGVKKIVSSKMDEMTTRVESLEGLAQRLSSQEAQAQVAKAQQKFEDFGEYQKPMLELLQGNPSLSPEQLYILAKHQSGKLITSATSKFSEKPTAQPSRARPKARAAETKGTRRAVWNNAVESALKNLIIE